MRPFNVRERSQHVRLTIFRPNNVFDLNSAHKKRIANHRPMTTPRNRFSAHQDTTLLAGQLSYPFNTLAKLC